MYVPNLTALALKIKNVAFGRVSPLATFLTLSAVYNGLGTDRWLSLAEVIMGHSE
jgi:hypothetical protein